MPAAAGDRRLVRVPGTMASHPPCQLTCPRCDSNNTKFCYYNNYNLSQPRYFCKSCRRYWTQGGTLRNVPVGGGSRKSSKRSRSPSVATFYSSPSSVTHEADSLTTDVSPGVKPEMDFPSFLNYQGEGYLTLGDYGFGDGSGFDENWGYPGNGHLGGFTGGDVGLPGGNTWQATNEFEGGVEGIVDEGFGWPGLAIQQQEKV